MEYLWYVFDSGAITGIPVEITKAITSLVLGLD
jgi:hypothetical protein